MSVSRWCGQTLTFVRRTASLLCAPKRVENAVRIKIYSDIEIFFSPFYNHCALWCQLRKTNILILFTILLMFTIWFEYILFYLDHQQKLYDLYETLTALMHIHQVTFDKGISFLQKRVTIAAMYQIQTCVTRQRCADTMRFIIIFTWFIQYMFI